MESRRSFLKKVLIALGGLALARRLPAQTPSGKIVTVTGVIEPRSIGTTLIHEHILVDFIGADHINPSRWSKEKVIEKMLPYLRDAKSAGCETLIDCTPNYLGRDVSVLKALAEQSGLNILTNTGYYGGSDNRFLPVHTFQESEEQLTERWLKEWEHGIDGTAVKPGFLKISVNDGPLSDVSKKLIGTAARVHLRSGLTIASHTGPYLPALEQVEILASHKVSPSAFIWVHAQNEKDYDRYQELALRGAWVSLDGLNDSNVDEYVDKVLFMRKNQCLHRTLVSHDAGWYDPAKPDGGEVRGYTTLFHRLIPALQAKGFSVKEFDQLLKVNPQEAFTIRVRRT